MIPHRALMNQGFETADGQRVDVETTFKDPGHSFRVAIVCATWLTGFDVECLSMPFRFRVPKLPPPLYSFDSSARLSERASSVSAPSHPGEK